MTDASVANSRYNLGVIIQWPTSVLAVYAWLILAALFVIVPLVVAYKAGRAQEREMHHG